MHVIYCGCFCCCCPSLMLLLLLLLLLLLMLLFLLLLRCPCCYPCYCCCCCCCCCCLLTLLFLLIFGYTRHAETRMWRSWNNDGNIAWFVDAVSSSVVFLQEELPTLAEKPKLRGPFSDCRYPAANRDSTCQI